MADDDKIQSEGRRDNAALPLNDSDNKGGPERYPSVRADDAIEGNPNPPQGAGDGGPQKPKP